MPKHPNPTSLMQNGTLPTILELGDAAEAFEVKASALKESRLAAKAANRPAITATDKKTEVKAENNGVGLKKPDRKKKQATAHWAHPTKDERFKIAKDYLENYFEAKRQGEVYN